MIVGITFDFDTDTYNVSNVRVLVPEEPRDCANKTLPHVSISSKPAKKSRAKSEATNQDIIRLEDNKLVLTEKLVNLLNAEPGDRIMVGFVEKDGRYFPRIAKSQVFADAEAGNKLTKSLTISYRGKQREELLIYGEEFTFEETSEGSGICILNGTKTIESDKTVISGNCDNKDDINTKEIKEELNTVKTYTRELKTSHESNLADFGFDINGSDEVDFDLDKLDLNDL